MNNEAKIIFWFVPSEPQTRAGPLLLPFPSPSCFLHRLQTSITLSFIKLEWFLRPFFKTRSHDESAHTFGSSLRFLEVPQKGVLFFFFFLAFLNQIFWHIWSYWSHLNFSKSPRSWHECRPIYGLHFVYIGFVYPLYQKRGFWGSKKCSSRVSGIFWPFWPSKWLIFCKARTLFKTIFVN